MADVATLETSNIPTTLEAVLDPAWLTFALAPVSNGRAVTAVETLEVLRTVATKVRFAVTFDGAAETEAFCIKGLLDVDEMTARGGPTMVREASFYTEVGPKVAVRTPVCVAAVIDRAAMQGIVVMRDLIGAGARFCSALEPFTVDQASASLDQLAALHAGRTMLDDMAWITPRVSELATMQHISLETLQGLLDGPRGEGLSDAVRNAGRLRAGMSALAERDASRPQFLVHGDAHAGNIFRAAAGGTGLIDWQLLQRGGWALDLAYHICAVLPVELAEREERRLLDHYLGVMRGLGCDMPDRDEAWRQYREAAIYGFYLWSITRRVDPPIIELFVNRLGMAVTRHDSHALLGVV
jgi:hypothetical protein